jgi:hypothetical protein
MDTIITHALKNLFKEKDETKFITVIETFGTLSDLIHNFPDLKNTRTFIIIFLWKRKDDDEIHIRLPMIINEKYSNRLKYEFNKDENKFNFTIDVNGQSNVNYFSKNKSFYGTFASDGSLFSKTVLDLRTFLQYKDDWMKMFPTDECWEFIEELK